MANEDPKFTFRIDVEKGALILDPGKIVICPPYTLDELRKDIGLPPKVQNPQSTRFRYNTDSEELDVYDQNGNLFIITIKMMDYKRPYMLVSVTFHSVKHGWYALKATTHDEGMAGMGKMRNYYKEWMKINLGEPEGISCDDWGISVKGANKEFYIEMVMNWKDTYR